ncbi:MAG: RNA repair transcriptional activator RtcR [Verrucomicrobiota bacterium]
MSASRYRQLVVIGLLGSNLDRGTGPRRWEMWRPSVALCQHEDLLVARFELLHPAKYTTLAQTVATDIASVSPETTVKRHALEFDDPWDFEEVYGALHDFARKYPFDLERERYAVHITTGTHVAQICLFLLTEAHDIPGVLIQTSPNSRSKEDAIGTYSCIDLDLSRYDKLVTRFHQEKQESVSFLKSGIATRSAAFNALIEEIERVAIASEDPILLMGPTGAGKSQLARKIYQLKRQRRQVGDGFVEVNCATIRGDGAMSALFGHTKGSFTGALRDRQGLLKAANGGLLFLDEIGELGLDEQAMLLRALEEHVFFPLGSDKEVKSEFQLIAGTNRDLHAEVAAGRFREDLLARIDLWTFRLPGLRERTEDLEPNLDYELEKFARDSGSRVTFNKEARTAYLKFATSSEAPWTANFRDLNASVVRMATLARSGRITVELTEQEIGRLRLKWSAADGSGVLSSMALARDVLAADQVEQIDPFDLVQLDYVIRTCRESRTLSEAGRRIFAVSRRKRSQSNDADRLRKYLLRFALTWEMVTTGRA